MQRAVVFVFLAAVLLGGTGSRPAGAEDETSVKQGVEDVQEDINRAIDRGVLWLLQQQMVDGSWGQDSARYPGGMTALAVYTLLKSGVPVDHPCVALGLENLLAVDAHETYVLACQLLALGAAGDPSCHPRMERLLQRLLAFEVRGTWSYPLAHEGAGFSERPGIPDLSNTQFAVLGLYAAHRAGLSVPRKVLTDILRQTRHHQQIPREVGGAGPRSAPEEAAGFAYRGPDQAGLGPATGSMTCAGITVLELCRRMLGRKLPGRHAQQVETSIGHALAWLGAHWTVEENPGQQQSHKLYYLYGLERVGSLLGRETIGGHPWYAEGARALLGLQKDGGAWGNASETAFALLFLLRATKGEVTGEHRAASARPVYASSADAPIRLRAEGHSPMDVWITAVHPDVKARHGHGGHVAFERVEYLVNDEVQVTVAQSTAGHGVDATHRVLLHFPHAGKYTVRARGTVEKPDGEATVSSDPLAVEVKVLVQPWAWHEARWRERDLRLPGRLRATASSYHNDHQGPEKAIDRHPEGYWVCEPKSPRDPRPALSIEVHKRLKANAVVLWPVPRRDVGRRRFDRPARFEVVVNGKGPPLVVTPEPDELRSTVVPLPKPVRIRSLEIAVPERTAGHTWPGECGFREVSFELEAVWPPMLEQAPDGRLVLACETPGARIHYTLDGRLPDTSSPRYEEPFAVPGRTRLHAVARLPTGETSRLLIATVP